MKGAGWREGLRASGQGPTGAVAIIRAMTPSQTDRAPRRGNGAVSDVLDLLASMRFAITLLSVICIASVIGTVVQQQQAPVNYVNQFGPFWAQVFGALGLYTVYSVAWFLLILAFLVVSTSLCIVRNTPKILVDVRNYKEHLRETSLKSFHHKASGEFPVGRDAAVAQVSEWLSSRGWKAKAQVRDNGVMVAAKKGSANKIGYLAAHSAIVLVCIGGLLDGDMVVRAQMFLAGKTPYAGAGLLKDVPPDHRLGLGNPTFRANLFVPEGARASTAVINLSSGVVLQDLPFEIELKKFVVEYYETGMPKLFASDIVVHDPDGTKSEARVKVNEPYFHRGVAIYQSSFEDGGSRVTLMGQPLGRGGSPFEVSGEIGTSMKLTRAGDANPLQLEFSGLRVINVENMSAGAGSSGEGATDVRKVDLTASLDKHLGSGAKPVGDKLLRNIGPSISYRLRDAAGQAREYNNYMVPVELDGQRVFLFGVRDTLDAAFRYLRVPADSNGTPDEWMRVRAALSDPAMRSAAAARYASKAAPADNPKLADQLKVSAERAINLFAGAERAVREDAPLPPDADQRAGLGALQTFVLNNVPEADRNRTADVLVRILNGSLFELTNLVRERSGGKALEPNETTQKYMGQTVLSLSESFAYPAPLVFTLKDFEQVQASVFQVSRAPGKKLVYLGCVLLIIGVFAMLYIRERRLWIWLQGQPEDARTSVTMALSATRQTMDNDREFDTLKQLVAPPATLANPAASS